MRSKQIIPATGLWQCLAATVLYSTLHYSTVLYCTLLYCTARRQHCQVPTAGIILFGSRSVKSRLFSQLSKFDNFFGNSQNPRYLSIKHVFLLTSTGLCSIVSKDNVRTLGRLMTSVPKAKLGHLNCVHHWVLYSGSYLHGLG